VESIERCIVVLIDAAISLLSSVMRAQATSRWQARNRVSEHPCECLKKYPAEAGHNA
jgi:hypothetical protein